MKVLIKARRRRASVVLATLALAVTGVGMGTADTESEGNEESPGDPARTMEISECIRSNETGEYWEGEVSTTLRKAEEELGRYVTDHPDTTTLLGFCSDRKGLLLTAPEITPDIDAAMAAARQHLSKGETIDSAISAAARGPLQDAIDAVMQGDQARAAGMIDASVSREGKIEMTVSAGSASRAVNELQAAFEAKAPGVVVEVASTEEPPIEFAATRLND